jgi:hypothetical protein
MTFQPILESNIPVWKTTQSCKKKSVERKVVVGSITHLNGRLIKYTKYDNSQMILPTPVHTSFWNQINQPSQRHLIIMIPPRLQETLEGWCLCVGSIQAWNGPFCYKIAILIKTRIVVPLLVHHFFTTSFWNQIPHPSKRYVYLPG